MSDEIAVSLIQLSQLVRECGYKVVLTCQGGDEILGGYPWTVIDNLIENMTWRDFFSLNLDAKDFIQGNILEGFASVQKYFNLLIRLLYIRNHIPFLKKLRILDLVYKTASTTESQQLKFQADDKDPLAKLLFESLYSMYKTVLNARGDRVEMSSSVEGRLPYLDEDLVYFMGELPSELKIKHSREKYLLYEAMKEDIPAEIYNRKKHVFVANQKLDEKTKTSTLEILTKPDCHQFNQLDTRKLLNKLTRDKLSAVEARAI